ncbi:F-box/kelch-repeat protein At3g06240-like [Papaver somniferum]|uniref:F-box/kelch-repeat protein At3g06240-like n=1 Tax=Papaver somniferum TaxID=3469 RepID=UPI000E701066|nr:F-box/kelch-repeat protein At3g06240-like [Papaver somniferum]
MVLFAFGVKRKNSCLWNFDTNEYKELPKSRNKPVDRIISSYAFGYDYSSGDYKVICLFSMGDISLVDVYKMGPNSWKSTQVIPYVMDTQVESGMLVNGFFHWLGHRIDNFSDVIISLDISIERFQVLQPPNIHLVKRWLSVGVLKECLCVLDNCGVNVEVWVMQDYGVQESWTRHYTITHERILYDHTLRLMWSFSSAEVLFVSGGSYLTDLVLFDPKDGSARKPNMHVENQVFTFPKAMSTIILKA